MKTKLTIIIFCCALMAHATITSDSVVTWGSPAMSEAFTAYASSTASGGGSANIDVMVLNINPFNDGQPQNKQASSCFIQFSVQAHWFSLYNDAGTATSAGFRGNGTTLSNSQCSVNLDASSYGSNGNQVYFQAMVVKRKLSPARKAALVANAAAQCKSDAM